MSEYFISSIDPKDKRSNQLIDTLLLKEGISRDKNLDYTCAMFDEEYHVVATGSCFGNTLRCLAVSREHQGEGLMNQMISHLTEIQFSQGNSHIFLYTKSSSSKFFSDLGFHEIVTIEDKIVFMENRKNGFKDYIDHLKKEKKEGKNIAAIVMNANPFTLGHLALVERATSENDILHIFIVSEDASLVPFAVRKHLIMDGCSHLNHICFHDSGPYMISNSTFPSYFQKDDQAVMESHALLDLDIFVKISRSLGINRRYVGEEHTSQVTAIYNDIMKERLPKSGIECIMIPRQKAGETIISASTVRQMIKNGELEKARPLLPETTLRFFQSPEAEPVIKRIKEASEVIHH